MRTLLQIFTNRKSAAITLLGFSSGLPLALTADTLQARLTQMGVTPSSLGLLALVTLPYAFKFLWAPFLDRFTLPLLGRRRGWIFVMQLLLLIAIAAMALPARFASPMILAGLALAVSFLSATQDIVIDAYRADLLDESERGPGAAVATTGYRLAMIASGAGALYLTKFFNWEIIYLLMALLMIPGLITTLYAPNPRPAGLVASASSPPQTLQDSIVLPLKDFLTREKGIAILLFILLFKLPDVMAGSMTQPFLQSAMQFKLDQIGLVRQGVGIPISIFGALAGGVLTTRLGLIRSLWLFALLQSASNAGFMLLARTGPSLPMLVTIVSVENFCAGLVTAGFTAYLMSQCDPRYSATQFALLTSLMALTRILGASSSGFLVQSMGYFNFFGITLLAGIPALLLLPLLPRHHDASPALIQDDLIPSSPSPRL